MRQRQQSPSPSRNTHSCPATSIWRVQSGHDENGGPVQPKCKNVTQPQRYSQPHIIWQKLLWWWNYQGTNFHSMLATCCQQIEVDGRQTNVEASHLELSQSYKDDLEKLLPQQTANLAAAFDSSKYKRSPTVFPHSQRQQQTLCCTKSSGSQRSSSGALLRSIGSKK